MTSIMHPKWQFVSHLDGARQLTQSAIQNLRMRVPVNAIIDPRMPAIAMARQAVAELDRAGSYNTYVPTGAVSAATRARSELLQGMATLDNGHPSLVPAVNHFQSTINWINVAKNYVVREPAQPPITILPVPMPDPITIQKPGASVEAGSPVRVAF